MAVVSFTDKDDNLVLDHPNRLLTDDNINELKSVINTNANAVSNVTNTSDANKPVSTAQAAAIAVVQNDVNTHEANTGNPHSVTKAQVGLSNVDNTADTAKPVSTVQQTQFDLRALLSSFVENEVPAGTINSVNVTFTLANNPIAASVKLYQNGIRLKAGGVDFSISGSTITFVTAPTTGDLLLADYRK